MKRREFISLFGGAAAAWPLAARAQQPKVPTIGALVIGNISPEEFWREFRQGLRDLGYIEGQLFWRLQCSSVRAGARAFGVSRLWPSRRGLDYPVALHAHMRHCR